MVRPYDRTHREAQAQQTRTAILDAAMTLMGSDGALSFARIAETAGVSEPTVYRNFANREALVAALSDHVAAKFRGPSLPAEVKDLPATAVATASYFAENPEMLRAAMRSGAEREVREHGRKSRTGRLRELLDEPTSHLDERDADAIKALFQTLVRAETWVEMTDRHHVESSRAGFAMAWAIDALLAGLRRDRLKGRKTITDEKLQKRAATLREQGRK